MNPIKILHLADVHYAAEHKEEALASLETLVKHAVENKPDLIVIAGDLFHKSIPNSQVGAFPELVDMIQRLLSVAPIVAVQGTITHDVAGCYDVLCELNAEHRFTLLDPACCYFLSDGRIFSSAKGGPWATSQTNLLILGCPEPGKEQFLTGKSGLGRDETNRVIQDGMRDILLGLGARRAEHPDLPCLFVYHGSVRGATLCNGQVFPGSDIVIGRDDLALVGAEYCALGHIHLAQQIGDMTAYFAGSVYPDWKGMEQKGFYAADIRLASIGTGLAIGGRVSNTTVRRIPFPHPPRKKIVTDNYDEVTQADVDGFRTWLCVHPPEGVLFDEEDALEWMLSSGALPGSRVTTEVIPTETVRAGEIQEAQGLVAKLTVWAENSGDELTASIIEKAELLEQRARNEGLTGTGLAIRWATLRLRGAIGILKGLGLEEIKLDLESYDPGVIALLGPNGSGKTTLAEMLSPFPELITRSGTLQSQFCLKDSYKELIGVDDNTSDIYRILVQIDPSLSVPKAEYHLYRTSRAGDLLKEESLTNGRLDGEGGYKAEVARLFGSMELYTRTTHTGQKPTTKRPEISEAARGEKRAIWNELAGLEYQQAYSDLAGETAKEIQSRIAGDIGKTVVLQMAVDQLPAKREAMGVTESLLETAERMIGSVQMEGRGLKAECETLRLEANRNAETKERIAGLKLRIEALENDIKNEHKCIETAQNAAKNNKSAQTTIDCYDKLSGGKEELERERMAHMAAEAKLSDEYADALRAYQVDAEALQAETTETERAVAGLETDKATLIAQIDGIEDFLSRPLENKCPECGQLQHAEGCPLLEELVHKRAVKQAALADKQEAALGLDNDLNRLVGSLKAMDGIKSTLTEPAPRESAPFAQQTTLDETLQALSTLDITEARKTLSEAQQAATRIEEGIVRAHNWGDQAVEMYKQDAIAREQLDKTIDARYEAKSEELEQARKRYTEAAAERARLEAEVNALMQTIKDLEKQAEELQNIIQSIEAGRRDVVEWLYLKRGCGPDGIQALELDAMSPEIERVANDLLSVACSHCEGGHYDRIRIETTRIAGKGGKEKQVEDFRILCHDRRKILPGLEWTDLGLISVGETVWVRKSLYDAFAAKRSSGQGTRYLTGILDEADGALDGENRAAYFAMVEAAHIESGRHQTIVVTHSEEAKIAIAQHINIAELGVPEREGV